MSVGDSGRDRRGGTEMFWSEGYVVIDGGAYTVIEHGATQGEANRAVYARIAQMLDNGPRSVI
ncbi:hypothetical protein LCGC14_2204530 [marine sediment metagenome]|uniref:Uncharacterized protein n=1 Tax=marine sediment metagenome TaxID=412755 RepID=A0A0F9DFL6_9ZZZZ